MAGPGLQQTQQLRQQMTMAPQMRQSLELLQVPALELHTLIQQEMEVNPTLELLEDAPEAATENEEREDGEDPVTGDESGEDAPVAEETPKADDTALEDFEILEHLDDEWREYFSQNQRTPYNPDDAARHQFALDSISQPLSLQQHLMNQVSLADLDADQQRLAELIIGSMDDDGYLTSSMQELAETTSEKVEALLDVLDIIREFDPIGVGATTLSECLWLQLKRLGRADGIADRLVLEHLDQLASHKYAELARALDVPVETIEKEARLIATLEPKPGRRFSPESPTYVTPEVSVIRNDEGEYLVIMNNEYIPRLHVSKHYHDLMHDDATPPDVKQYIRDKVRASLFLIKSINQRQQTIYNIAREIVRIQKDFLDHGVSHLRPLIMAEIAGIVGVHETTVSRAIAGKYMQTPRGTFEMKYFFTPGYRGADGQSVSNQTIKDTIARLIGEEDPAHPLSDQTIAEKLASTGFNVARRTIAKYREELKILPSHLRKQNGK